MIQIDFKNGTYRCPFCGHFQAYGNSMGSERVGRDARISVISPREKYAGESLAMYWFECSNAQCGKMCIVSIDRNTGERRDIYPQFTFTHFPDYVPLAIRNDYEEACAILDLSPKASSTLLRRCLQGMIRDFWSIRKSRLCDEIAELQGKISPTQWKAIDGVRKIGNVSAHMEKDVNLIIDVKRDEADKLRKLIELLMSKWYISRHDEEELCADVATTADQKQQAKQ